MTKQCRKCHQEKPLSSFFDIATRPGQARRHPHTCIECVQKDARAKYWRNPEKYKAQVKARYSPSKGRNQKLKRNFGIDQDWYQKKLDEQKGVCAICHQPETTSRNGKLRPLMVDHNHTTGQVRGLLCHHCNTMIGLAKERADVFQSALCYLQAFSPCDCQRLP